MSPFDVARFERLRADLGLGFGVPLHHRVETGSTNDDALAAARSGAREGTVFVAEAQTRGRGRRGRSWRSAPGANLTFSLVLRPRLPVDRVATLALAAGLAVRAAASRHVEPPLGVKWPNDVVTLPEVGTGPLRKLAGVLVESSVARGVVEAVVVGVGLNVDEREFSPDVAEKATSLALLGGQAQREDLLVQLLRELEDRVESLQGGGLPALLEELRAHDALRGRRVSVDGSEGVARGISERGELLLEGAGGVRAVLAGTVDLSD